MSKLFKLKEWLTVPDAAQHLSGVFGEPVTEADVLRLGLDGHYKLSVRLRTPTHGLIGVVCRRDEARCVVIQRDHDAEEYPVDLAFSDAPDDQVTAQIVRGLLDGSLIRVIHPIDIGRGKFVQMHGKVVPIRGLWALPTTGDHSDDNEELIAKVATSREPHSTAFNGILLERSPGIFAQLLWRREHDLGRPSLARERDHEPKLKPYEDPAYYTEAYNLPDDAILVVRTSELANFITRTAEAESGAEPKKESTREKNTLLKIISVMTHQKYSKEITKPYAIAAHLEQKADELGIKVSGDTIAHHIITALELTKKSDRTS